MSAFYTNAFCRGSRLFIRGYRDGAKFKDIIQYEPTLYVGKPAGYDTHLKAFISEQPVEEIKFESIRDARDFVKKYEDVEGFKIFGNTNYVNQYVGYKWTKDVPYDESKIDVMFMDIETTVGEARKYPDNHKIKIRKINSK